MSTGCHGSNCYRETQVNSWTWRKWVAKSALINLEFKTNCLKIQQTKQFLSLEKDWKIQVSVF